MPHPRNLGVALLLSAICALSGKADVTEGLVAHWTFDEGNGNQLADVVGGHHGVVHGATPGQEGRRGTSYLFSSAADNYVDAGDSLQLPGNQATIAAVVRARAFTAPLAKGEANSRNGIFGSDNCNMFFALTDQGRVVFAWDAGQRDYQHIFTDPADAVPESRWCHVAATRDGATMTLYVNGVARKAQTHFSPGPFGHLDRNCIGRINGKPGRDFDGWIDDLRVYDRPLSPSEIWSLAKAAGLANPIVPAPGNLRRVSYNNPGLVVDLSVGLYAWPLPMDCDGDGDLDLIVSCSDVPYNKACLFENPGGDAKMPVFKPAVPVGSGMYNVQISYTDGQPRVLLPAVEFEDVRSNAFALPRAIPLDRNIHPNKVRANQWKYCDYDGDDRLDLIVGVGDWTDYGWDDAFNREGQWTRGPLHGYVYLIRNRGTNQQPAYEEPTRLTADGKSIDVFGMPSPNMADFDGDGDLDLICGEFVDKFTYFQNEGTRTDPQFRAGRYLTHGGEALTVDSCMFVPVAVDWDHDGDMDLIVGQVDGRVMLVENTGRLQDGVPQFRLPRFFQQQADAVKFGVLVTPASVDWDNDGDQDLICGNAAGYIGFIENLDGGCPPKWSKPKLLESDGKTIRIVAGPNGSIQGPCEAKWGYTTLSACDWDHDGLTDLVVNSIWGKVVWYRNVGTREVPKLAAARPLEVEWSGNPPKPAWNWWDPKGKSLATQWRTTPVVIDWNHDGLNDLVMLDVEGYLAFFERRNVDGVLRLLPPARIFHGKSASAFDHAHRPSEQNTANGPLRLNTGNAGRSGRRKICFVDWDRDGRTDLLVNSRSINFLRNVSTNEGKTIFEDMGQVDTRRLAGHTTSPSVVDWDNNGVPDLVVGAEDGFLYHLENPFVEAADGNVRVRFLGINGFEFQRNGETLLIDPYVSRDPARVCVSKTTRKHIKKADYILLTHSHWDHAGDVAEIAAYTDAVIVGSETTLNICRHFKIAETRLRRFENRRTIQLGRFSVTPLKSRHKEPVGYPGYYHQPPTKLDGAPDYLEGGTWALLVKCGGHSFLNLGSANLIDEELRGIRCDYLLAGIAGRAPDYLPRLLKCVDARILIPTHWDNFFGHPVETPGERISLPDFHEEMKTIAPHQKVNVLEVLETIELP